jgi:hypothetical protein
MHLLVISKHENFYLRSVTDTLMVWGKQFAEIRVRGQVVEKEKLVWTDSAECNSKNIMWPEDGKCNSGELRRTPLV